MEPITHMLTGACLSRSGFNRKTAYATFAMVIAAAAPDLDMLWGLRGPVSELQHHRGITHTLLGAPFMAPGTVAFVLLLYRLRLLSTHSALSSSTHPLPVRWGWLWLCALVADLSHILLDYGTNYGVRPFFPFHDRWYAWSIVGLFDLVTFFLLLLSLAMPSILRSRAAHQPFRGRGWAWAGLILIAFWWGLRDAQHARAEALLKNALPAQVVRTAAEPHWASPFRWRAIAETGAAYRVADVRSLSGRVQLNPIIIARPRVTPAVKTAERSYLGRVYIDWSQWPLIQDQGSLPIPAPGAPPPGDDWHSVEFFDLRFYNPGLTRDPGDRSRRAGTASRIGWVYVDAQSRIGAMYLHGARQR